MILSIDMFLESLINQEGTGSFDLFWILVPLLCCVIFFQGRRNDGGGGAAKETVSESWYTVQDIETTFRTIEATVAEWRKEANEKMETSKGILSNLKDAFGRGKLEDRFVTKETISPRLYRLTDPTGPIFFELIEVAGGGTVVKATFGSDLRGNMAKFKANLPLKIPATPIGNRCPACGKPVLPDFKICPYCGEKIIEV